jgi:tRNA A-37 threonylcarbamoyl transferase component Bud32
VPLTKNTFVAPMIITTLGYKLHCFAGCTDAIETGTFSDKHQATLTHDDAQRIVESIERSLLNESKSNSHTRSAKHGSLPSNVPGKSEEESDGLPRQIEVLGGRGLTGKVTLSDGTPVIVKHYRRGGVLRLLVNRRYLRMTTPRPKREFDMLRKVKECGVNAPQPVAWIQKGSFIYQGWLASVQIPNVVSLAELSITDVDRAVALLPRVAAEVEKLIRENIFHVDMHPGNVLITEDGSVALIDFDKAHIYGGAKNKLRDLYICRWRRAVLKHKLSHRLVEGMCGGLLKRF